MTRKKTVRCVKGHWLAEIMFSQRPTACNQLHWRDYQRNCEWIAFMLSHRSPWMTGELEREIWYFSNNFFQNIRSYRRLGPKYTVLYRCSSFENSGAQWFRWQCSRTTKQYWSRQITIKCGIQRWNFSEDLEEAKWVLILKLNVFCSQMRFSQYVCQCRIIFVINCMWTRS